MTQIDVYTTKTCPHCTRLKQWLSEHDYEYVEHQVDENREKAKEMIERTGRRGVPQALIGDQAVVGYQPKKIQEAVKNANANS